MVGFATVTPIYKFKSMMMQRLKGKTNKASKSREHDEETINELREAFKIFDSKNTGMGMGSQARSMRGN